nr:immunoglobulin light chain junction region [Macaca mulatta]
IYYCSSYAGTNTVLF